MTGRQYDTIVIGAGLAGLTVGSVLSCYEREKVLILERERYVGGRIVSFTGVGDRLVLQGESLDEKAFRRTLKSVYTWVTRSDPDLETIFSRGLLDGYSFEAGGHATFWGSKGRIGSLLNFLQTPVDFPGNQGFTVLDPESEALYTMEKGSSFPWMSSESNRNAKLLLREMLTASEATLKEWDRISFHQWLSDRTDDRRVYEYLAAIASIHMVMGEPRMIPAGDFIRLMNTAGRIGMNLISGSTGIVPKPGFVRIAEVMAEKIRECGGVIETGAEVKELLMESGSIKGVRVITGKGEEILQARRVVCTVPVRKIWSFLDETRFDKKFVTRVKENFFSVGMLTGIVGTKSNIFLEAGLPPKSWLLAPAVIKAEEGYIGDVDIISIMPGNFEPSLVPGDKYSIGYSIALTEGELRDKKKVDRVIEVSRNLFHRVFPAMKTDTLWEIWTCSDQGFGDWPPTGEKRPDIVHPSLEGLFFAGDGYGAETWGSGMDAAVHSALQCVDTITGGTYLEKVLPEYHR